MSKKYPNMHKLFSLFHCNPLEYGDMENVPSILLQVYTLKVQLIEKYKFQNKLSKVWCNVQYLMHKFNYLPQSYEWKRNDAVVDIKSRSLIQICQPAHYFGTLPFRISYVLVYGAHLISLPLHLCQRMECLTLAFFNYPCARLLNQNNWEESPMVQPQVETCKDVHLL